MTRIGNCVSQNIDLKENSLFQVGTAVAAFLLPILAALLASGPASAQVNIPNKHSVSGPETPTTAGPARPKLKYDGHFRLKSNDGTYRYSLYYYFEQDGGFSDLQSHVFYPPPLHLVTDKDGNIRRHIDEDEEVLTLWVRQPSSFELIENDLRQELSTVAVEKYDVDIIPGTDPYRISVLPLNSAIFEFTKSKDKSDHVEGIGLAEGDIVVHFHGLSAEEAGKLTDNLEKDNIQLLFRYTFSAVSDETCAAKFEGGGVQDIDLFKKVKGKGGEGLVARHQTVNIADDLVAQEIFKIRCAEGEMLADLTEILMDRLGKQETRKVADWESLDALIAFDENSFKADVTKELKTVENEVTRKQALDAMSKAMNNAKKVGVELGYKLFAAEAKGTFEDSDTESKAEARKAFMDALRKTGKSVEWDGDEFIPKTVDVHSVADLDAKWARNLSFEYSIPQGLEGREDILLTASDRTALTSGPERLIMQHRLEQLEAKMANLSGRLASEEAAVADLSKRMPSSGDIWNILHVDDKEIALRTGEPKHVVIAAQGTRKDKKDKTVTRGYDVDIRATDDVDIRATDDVDIRATDDVDIRAEGDVDIRAEGDVDIRGEKFSFNKKPLISVKNCHYVFKRRDSQRRATNFYRTLGEKDQNIAVVSGFSQESDCYEPPPSLTVLRMGSDNKKWRLDVQNWRCDRLDVHITFMKGVDVTRVTTYRGRGKGSHSLRQTDSWCAR